MDPIGLKRRVALPCPEMIASRHLHPLFTPAHLGQNQYDDRRDVFRTAMI
jgi:hypothetical protein